MCYTYLFSGAVLETFPARREGGGHGKAGLEVLVSVYRRLLRVAGGRLHRPDGRPRPQSPGLGMGLVCHAGGHHRRGGDVPRRSAWSRLACGRTIHGRLPPWPGCPLPGGSVPESPREITRGAFWPQTKRSPTGSVRFRATLPFLFSKIYFKIFFNTSTSLRQSLPSHHSTPAN